MGVLLLKLSGPMQSWGTESRFTERKTFHEPSKSGIIGLLAAALGRYREDPIDDLAQFFLAVRIDQPGKYLRDFQTAHPRSYDRETESYKFTIKGGKYESLPLSQRYYLANAIFVVGIEVPDPLLTGYSQAILHPAFPLYLGRRSCSPAGRIFLDCREGVTLEKAIKEQPWQATDRYLINNHSDDAFIGCELIQDLQPSDNSMGVLKELRRDVPLSFSQEHREYGWRTIGRSEIMIPNPFFSADIKHVHDPMAALKEVV